MKDLGVDIEAAGVHVPPESLATTGAAARETRRMAEASAIKKALDIFTTRNEPLADPTNALRALMPYPPIRPAPEWIFKL